MCRKRGVEPYGTTADGVFTVQPSECLGACADAPVMLVNDRQMLSFMGKERLDELLAVLKRRDMIDLSKFKAAGQETCFHGRHIGAQIYAGLDGSNWRLQDYVARGGLRGRLSDGETAVLYLPGPGASTVVKLVRPAVPGNRAGHRGTAAAPPRGLRGGAGRAG